MINNRIQLQVMRYRPGQDQAPWAQTFEIEWTAQMSVLDALALIKDELAPDLAYRWSCRMEICGSCGVLVNGEPKLACATFVRDYAQVGTIVVGALDQFPIEKDLIVQSDGFIEKISAVKPYIISKNPRALQQKENIQTPAQLDKFKQYSLCINCMLCYQACPQVGLNSEFLGPAAIALAHRYNLDSRDDGKQQRFSVLNQEDGLWPCTFVGYCSDVCPKQVDPAGAIQQAKATAIGYWALQNLKKEPSQ